MVTTMKAAIALLCVGSTLVPRATIAQNTKLEKEFIFFVDGVNVQVPEVAGGTVVNDPINAESGNKVLRYGGGSWAENGFVWPTAQGGVDLSDFTSAEYGGSDTLFLKILVDPINQNRDLKLTFFDKGVVGPIESADLRFRMNFSVPAWSRDGKWHDLVIPLPPSTSAALDSAKAGKKVDGTDLGIVVDTLMQYWTYGGAWGSGAGVWGSSEANWKEWEWNAAEMIGFHYDWSGETGPVYIDDFYIGGKSTDLEAASSTPQAVGAVSIQNANKINTLSWTANEDANGYQVYYSNKPFTSVSDPEVVIVGRVTNGVTTIGHKPLAPHPNLATTATSYYAVTSLSNFGKENSSIDASYKSITGGVTSTAWIQEVDEETAFEILDNIDAGIVTMSNFPEGLIPFEVNPSSLSTAGNTIGGADDLTSKAWVVYFEVLGTGTFLVYYTEIIDDARQFALVGNGSGAWNYDSIEIGFSGYPVESFLVGSSHDAVQRGAEPDYQFRVGKFADQEDGFVFESWRFNDLVPNSQCLVDSLYDANNNVIGYKLIAAINIEQLQGGTESDVFIDLPNDSEMKLYPFLTSVNDADGNGREIQLNWSYKANTADVWYNTPKMLPSVAFAGKGIVVSNEPEDQNQFAASFELSQNYPNPFNPSTKIDFTLTSQSNVTLEVFNVLGQKVATLANGVMSAGKHSVNFDATSFASGMYLYKITAGSFVSSKKMMLIK